MGYLTIVQKDMPQHHIRDLWKETLSSGPVSKDSYRGMHLAVLHRAVRQRPGEHLASILFEVGGFTLCESKGNPQVATPLSLSSGVPEALWLCFQFQGTIVFPGGTTGGPDTLYSFVLPEADPPLTLHAGKHWALCLGVSGVPRELLLAELPLLREHIDRQPATRSVRSIWCPSTATSTTSRPCWLPCRRRRAGTWMPWTRWSTRIRT